MKIGVHRHFCLCKMKDFSDPNRLSSILTKGLASLFNCSPGVALIGNLSCVVRRCLRACLYTAQWSFPGSSMVKKKKKVCLQCRRHGFDPWAGKIPWRTWQPTPVFLLGKLHGLRCLVDYSPEDGKESDTTEWLSMYACVVRSIEVYTVLLIHFRNYLRDEMETMQRSQ